ncbi:MAG TPA: beta-ketoacyl-ACP synthase III [bacterium]|nr:beta-ketoacyl-ACP synthase III [bacterium]HPP30219.1 beta-ketoacyl-ACP synthase III [bacterium]
MGDVTIAGTGSFLPSFVLNNSDFEMMVDTSDEWIVTRTGIKERRICPKNMASSDMGVEAAKSALKDSEVSPENIDFIICATVSPDKFFPSTACLIQAKLGIKDIPAFDISAACSGFIFGLEIARNLIAGGGYKTGLVIASECMSRLTDYTDRSICVLLGDGAGAAVVKASETPGIMGSYISSDGSYGDILNAPAGGSARPASFDTVEKRLHFMKMEGAALFKIAIETMCEAINKLLKRFNMKKEDISLIIPHQANLRIINGVAKGLGLPPEKFYVNIEKYGNMSAACIPVALDEAAKKGLIKKGDIIATVAFGGGLTWGANLIKWTK